MKRFIIILAAAALLTGCETRPDAFFYTDKVVALTGEEIFFTNDSYNATWFEWDFGDGTFSTAVNPVKSYNSTGIFNVELKAFGKNGTVGRAYQTIEVKSPTILEVEVLEYYDEYPVANASVILYGSLNDWDSETNPIIEGYTNANGKVTFTNLNAKVYYVDVWHSTHNNYTLRDEDVAYIATQRLVPNQINRFVAWVDYTGTKKSTEAATRDRSVRIVVPARVKK